MKTWFITGTSRGFGRLMTELLLDRGDRVAATLRDPARLDELAVRHGDRLWRAQLDVTDTARLRKVVDSAFADLGRIDVVVSNAGHGLIGLAEEVTDEQIERQLAIHVVAPIQLVRAVTPHLRAQGGGHVVQTSSMGGHIAFPGMSLYHAGKWGVEGFFEAYALETEPFGIRTTLVEPGMVATDFFGAADLAPSQLPAYAGTPAAELTHGRMDVAVEDMPGDPLKVAEAMVRIGDLAEPPRRQLLGSDAYRLVHDALTARLADVETQREVAFSTDRDGFTPPQG
ncbi:SDR family oxidoreductase [Streptomyces sp. NPDC048057]|uniref:SDR family oxidoreductase n=1 Tax=Streptomyces sp. NPDC048057 TaxID=3155628 RepID=UPI0033FBF207